MRQTAVFERTDNKKPHTIKKKRATDTPESETIDFHQYSIFF
jgi:hypothetical protein